MAKANMDAKNAVALGALIGGFITYLPKLVESRNDNLIEFTQQTRNDFLTLVETDLVSLPIMPDLLDQLQNMVSGYFLQAVSLMTDIDGVDVRERLSRTSTKRDPIEDVFGKNGLGIKALGGAKSMLGTESFDYGLPRIEHAILQVESESFVAESDSKSSGGVSLGKGAVASLSELSNLSTGKTLEVVFEKNGTKTTVPVTIRLAVTDTDSETMTQVLSATDPTNTFKGRTRRWKSGELSFWKDLIMCNDIIDENRRLTIKDKSKFYKHMMKRLNKNFLSGTLSLNPSINNASAILVYSADTAKEVALNQGGDLDDFAIRQRIFKSTASMLMVVVNEKWREVTIYHRGIEEYTTLSESDIKRGAKGQVNVNDIIAAYDAGNAPR